MRLGNRAQGPAGLEGEVGKGPDGSNGLCGAPACWESFSSPKKTVEQNRPRVVPTPPGPPASPSCLMPVSFSLTTAGNL